MRPLDPNPPIACLSALERPPSADHRRPPGWLASESSAIDRGTDDELTAAPAPCLARGRTGRRPPGRGRGPRPRRARRPRSPKSRTRRAWPRATSSIATSISARAISSGSRSETGRNSGPDTVHASNVVAAPKSTEASARGPRALNRRSTLGRVSGVPDPVPDPRLGGDQVAELAARVGRRDLASKPADVHVEVVILARVLPAPHGAQQPAVGHEPARTSSAGS